MIVDRHSPVNLTELVPKLRLEMEPELRELDRLLSDDELFAVVKADLSKRYPNSGRLGRRSMPVEVVQRMLVLRRSYDWGYEATERTVSDSLVLRQFARSYLEPAPDGTTLTRWAGVLGSETLRAVNERAVELAKSLEVTRGRKLGTDGTVVEADIRYPTDNSLLGDGVRVLSRLVGRARRRRAGSCTGGSWGSPGRACGRRRDKGESGLDRWVGWGVLTSNLSTIARTVAAP